MTVKDSKAVVVVLDGLINILETASNLGELDQVATLIEECHGIDKIEELQHHENETIYEKALSIITKYFTIEANDEEVSSTTNGQAFEFGANPPSQGFSF